MCVVRCQEEPHHAHLASIIYAPAHTLCCLLLFPCCMNTHAVCLLLQNVSLVAASSAAAHEAAFFGVPQTTLEEAGGKVG